VVRLKTRVRKIFDTATNRALRHVGTRASYEVDALVVSFALASLPLFGKLRSTVSKPRP
jgi:hypothetical protein